MTPKPIITLHACQRVAERGGNNKEVRRVLPQLFPRQSRRPQPGGPHHRHGSLSPPPASRRSVAEMVIVLAPNARLDHHPGYLIIPSVFALAGGV